MEGGSREGGKAMAVKQAYVKGSHLICAPTCLQVPCHHLSTLPHTLSHLAYLDHVQPALLPAVELLHCALDIRRTCDDRVMQILRR